MSSNKNQNRQPGLKPVETVEAPKPVQSKPDPIVTVYANGKKLVMKKSEYENSIK